MFSVVVAAMCVCVGGGGGETGFINYFLCGLFASFLLVFVVVVVVVCLFVFVFYLVGGILTGWLIKILNVFLFRNGWIEVACFSFSRKRHVRMCDFFTVGFQQNMSWFA